MNAQQRVKVRKLVQELKQHRANHTEFVSVYVPAGYDMNKITTHLYQEMGTAENIKSTSTRKNVKMALEKMIQHLKTYYPKTPSHGVAVFSGNVASREGKEDIKVWSLEPPVELGIRMYRCEKDFVIDVLEGMLQETSVYALVVIDRREATIGLLRGKTIVPLVDAHSMVPGKFKAGGQCLVKETWIQSCDGNILQIKNSHNPMVVKSMVIEDFSLADSPVTDKWETKKSRIYKVITKYPRMEVQASKDHVFFVKISDGIIEKTAEELKEGDFLIMPELIHVKGQFQTINALQYYNSFIINKQGQELLKSKREEKSLLQRELAKLVDTTQTTISSYEIGKLHADRIALQKVCAALKIDFYEFLNKHTVPHLYQTIKLPVVVEHNLSQFLGYLVGDGCLEKDRITFFEQNAQVALYYKKLFDQHFQLNSSYRFRESKNYHQLRFTSRPLVRLIQSEFPEIKKTLDTTIPEKILKSPNQVVASFLGGLFDAEGYVSGGRIGLGMNNKPLIQQIQIALLRFSIISSMQEYDNHANEYSKNHRFTIEISEKQSLESFEKHIGFTSLKKSARLQDVVKEKTSKSSVRQLLASGTEIRRIVEKAGYNLQLFPKVTNFFRDERLVSKEVFKNSILAKIQNRKLYAELLKIYNFPFLPVKINKIEVKEETIEMVDISIGNRNFIANGVIVHNSAQRFHRVIEGMAKDFYKKVGDLMKDQLLEMKELKGIIIGGPGPTKEDFINGDFITNELKKRIIGVKDLSYTGEYGLQELLDKSQDILAQEEVAEEKKYMEQFFTLLAKQPGKVAYGEKEVEEAIQLGMVDTLLVSESLGDDRIDKYGEEADKEGTKLVVISVETREGVQLKELGGLAAILRYERQ